MTDLRLVVFDVDGTLVDSEADIVAAMDDAYASIGAPAPGAAAVRAIVGLSLDAAFVRLSPELSDRDRTALREGYKNSYMGKRAEKGAAVSSPLFPGARAVLEQLRADPWTLLAVATGKSQRGLDKLIEAHGFEGWFVSRQVADFHPSKPHPSMLQTILSETGVPARRAVMVGDTSYDIDMARAAGIASIGVGWGYHPVEALAADEIVRDFQAIPAAVTRLTGQDRENR
jgi:phosphoglycolate phosphatase